MDRHINAGPSWDDLLLNEAYRNGWYIPCQPSIWKRLPVIRHLRALRLGMEIDRRHEGAIPRAYDIWMVNIIWRGWC